VRLGTADRATPDGSALLAAVPVTSGLRERWSGPSGVVRVERVGAGYAAGCAVPPRPAPVVRRLRACGGVRVVSGGGGLTL
ncbi:hypothetical protein, partial [Streptomyces prunicolor]|uniref:hypothetical protein n=1 Tax=Streptomyces prunicolor TaxID=67348 RepID=UPI0033F089ED